MLYHWLFMLSFLIIVLLADFTTAAIHWDEMLVKHTWNAIPANWESVGNKPAEAMIKLYIALKPDKEGALIDTLYEVSNPEHRRYGAHISKEQLSELVSPHTDTLELVHTWLIRHGIRPSSISTSHGGSWLTVTDVLVSQANQLLGASYQVYRNSKTGHTTIRTVGYSLPAVLHACIETVAPTTHFPSTWGMRQTPRGCSSGVAPEQAQAASGKNLTARLLPGVTPSAMRSLYKSNTYSPTLPYQNSLGILGIYEDYPSQSDLTDFMAMYRSDGIDADFRVEKVNNGSGDNPNTASDVANFEIQYAAAMSYPTPLTFYDIGGDTEWDRDERPIFTDMYLEWFGNILEDPYPPPTISISYGEPEDNLPEAYARSLCDLYARLGARGVTVLVASGQDGVGQGVGAGICISSRGRVQFRPEFPSSCPHVTSVGGTTNFRPEIAASLSGGGFSFYFPAPFYQYFQVRGYLANRGALYNGLYNRHGRGYPDISAQAVKCQFLKNNEVLYMNGTICSVSIVAGLVALCNDFTLNHSGRTLGFLNPLLYSNGYGIYLKDVWYGSNPGCGTNGFSAAIGWDPVTGRGTLNFEGLLTNWNITLNNY